jgi:hypothetical protein
VQQVCTENPGSRSRIFLKLSKKNGSSSTHNIDTAGKSVTATANSCEPVRQVLSIWSENPISNYLLMIFPGRGSLLVFVLTGSGLPGKKRGGLDHPQS